MKDHPSVAGDASPKPLLIGWKEYVDFPEWGIRRVKVKIDTGARTSALGVVDYELQQAEQGPVAHLQLAPYRRHPNRIVSLSVPVQGMVVVSNSGGLREQRPLIEAKICLGPLTKTVFLTLADRRSMLLPMILGRKALEDDFIVDVSKKFLMREARRVKRGR